MGRVIAENFDGVTAPALPGSVTAALVAGASAATSTTNALSSPNSVVINIASAGPEVTGTVYSKAPDNSNGNCTVSAAVNFSGSVPLNEWNGVVLGIGQNTQAFLSGADTCYAFCISATTSISLARSLTGTGAVITIVGGSALFTTGVWYTLSMTRNGSNFWCSCSQTISGTTYWLTSSFTWQANNYVACIIATDPNTGGAIPSVASYGGVTARASSNISLYCDNFSVYDQKFNFPTGPLKGMNVVPATSLGQGDWYQVWGQFINTSPGGIQTQIALANSAHCNAIRMIGGLEGVYYGQYTVGTYFSRLSQIINYCKSLGMWYYHSEALYGPYFGAGDPTQQQDIFSGMITNYVQTAQVLAGFSNVVAFDIFNEFNLNNYITLGNGTTTSPGNFAMTTAQWLTLFQQAFAAIRVVAPNLPLTADFYNNLTAPFSTYSYLFDLMDSHHYYTGGAGPAPGDMNTAVYGSVGTSGKPIFMSEIGDLNLSDNTAAIQATMTAIWNNDVLATYPGQPGCIGGCWWSVVPTNSQNGFMFSGANPGVPSAWEPQYAGYSAPTFSFGSNFRRRRR